MGAGSVRRGLHVAGSATIKSDDVLGRSKAYESIVKGEPIRRPSIPESFNVLVKELQALGLKWNYEFKEEVAPEERLTVEKGEIEKWNWLPVSRSRMRPRRKSPLSPSSRNRASGKAGDEVKAAIEEAEVDAFGESAKDE